MLDKMWGAPSNSYIQLVSWIYVSASPLCPLMKQETVPRLFDGPVRDTNVIQPIEPATRKITCQSWQTQSLFV